MVLSDGDILKEIKKGELKIKPFKKDSIQPSSYDLHISSKFLIFKNSKIPYIDVKEDMDNTELVDVKGKGFFFLHPGEFVLSSTLEYISNPDYLVARIEGKSSLGRIGLIIHATAGFVDPGFRGTLTLEMTNLINTPIKIYVGMKIAQLAFFTMTSPSKKSYGEYNNKYNNQKDPTKSHYFKNFSK